MESICQQAGGPVARPIAPPHKFVEPDGSAQYGEWLTFRLGDGEYAVDILHVQEIRSYDLPTRMVNAPAAVKGVIHLRGIIVPVVDMRIHFNLPEVRYDAFTVVIVLNINDQVVGMVIDGVSDVVRLGPQQISPAPHFSSAVAVSHVHGIGSIGDRTLLLLDIVQLMQSPVLGVTPHRLQ
jgi:purine-binding chemotaxis protein CheW